MTHVHNLDRHDALEAVARYRELTGDKTSILENDGPMWSLKGTGLEAYGKATFTLVMRAFNHGFVIGNLAGHYVAPDIAKMLGLEQPLDIQHGEYGTDE